MNNPKSITVTTPTEFYLAVAQLTKPITLKPLAQNSWTPKTLTNIECQSLLNFGDALGPCQCSSEPFPPEFPFIVEEFSEQ